jgi:hypothetical protein
MVRSGRAAFSTPRKSCFVLNAGLEGPLSRRCQQLPNCDEPCESVILVDPTQDFVLG